MRELLGSRVHSLQGDSSVCASRVADVADSNLGGALIFARTSHLSDIGQKLKGAAAIILTDSIPDDSTPGLSGATLLAVDNPRLCFIHAAQAGIGSKTAPGIHPTAIIAPNAQIHDEARVEAYAVVGAAFVGAGSCLGSHSVLDDAVELGQRVHVQSGSTLGSPGFGFERNEQGELERFPQLGTLLVEDDVQIGSGCRIDRAALGKTHLGLGTKIDNAVYIAHNVIIGQHCLVVGGSNLCGGVKVGDRVFIGAGADIRQKISIGDDAVIGMGAVVVDDVEPGQTVAGVPARPLYSE